MTSPSRALAALAMVGAVGCAPGPRALLAGPSDGPALAPDEADAVDRIARTRAKREQSCLPPERRGDYDAEERLRTLTRDTATQTGASRCKSNVHLDAFAACVVKIRETACGVDLADVSAIEPCTTEALCGPRPNATW